MKKELRECYVCGSDKKLERFEGKLVCGKHKAQVRRHGKILDRTRFDANEIIDKEDYCEVIIYDKNGNKKGKSFIDKEDRDKVKKYKWHFLSNGYVSTDLKTRKLLRLHRYVLGLKTLAGGEVDHINGDRADNRKANLRIVTRSQNLMNKNGVKGYYFDNHYKKWKAEIIVNGKKIGLGSFDTEEEAKAARLEGERKYFGEYSKKVREENLK